MSGVQENNEKESNAEFELDIKAQVPVKCNMCKSQRGGAKWICATCPGPLFLCENCKTDHLQVEVWSNHKIFPYVEGIMAIPQKCPIHPDKTHCLFCKLCDTPICTQCLVESHNVEKHVKCELSEALIFKKNELANFQFKLDTKIVSSLAAAKEAVYKKSEIFTEGIRELKAKIDFEEKEITEKIQKMCHRMREDVSKLEEKHNTEMKLMEREICQNEENIKEVQKQGNNVMEGNISSISCFLESHSDWLIKHPPHIPKFFVPQFLSCQMSSSTLRRQIGTLVFVTEVYTHSTFLNPKKIVFQTENNKLTTWIAQNDSKMIQKLQFDLISLTPDHTEELHTQIKVQSFTGYEKDFLVVDRHNHCIYRMTKKGKKTKLLQTSNAHPHDILISKQNEIIICMFGKISKYSYNGKQKFQDIEYDAKFNMTANDPQYIVQNGNGDFIFIDRNIQQYSVVCIDNTGRDRKWKFDYEIDKMKKANFHPKGLACDKLWNILVSDFAHNEVLILSQEGKYLNCLLTVHHGITRPLGLGIDPMGRLWVGQSQSNDKSEAKLSVFKYLFE